MKIRDLVLSGFLMTGVVLASCSKKNNDKLNDQDEDFLIKASISNSAEVSAATLANTKATNAKVKAFAQQMIMEHSMAQNDLKNVGNAVGFPVKDTIDPAHVAIAAQLSMMSGRAFDSAYMHTQVADHKTTVALFQTELSNGRQRDVLNFANTYLPHIQMHLQSADSIANAYFKR
jgi:putative membrane protein